VKNLENKIPLCAPWFEKDDIDAVMKVLESGNVNTGWQVELLERELEEYLGCKHVVCVNSATAALHCALIATRLPSDSEVIVPAFTFPSTAQIPYLCNLKPVFADVEYYTYNISPTSVEAAVTEKTRAIIPVSSFGLPYDLAAIRKIADAHDLLVIADNAGAIGSRYMGDKIGNARCDLFNPDGTAKNDGQGHQQRGFAEDVTIFSFHPTKTITGVDGGALCTNDEDIAAQARILRKHGAIHRDEPERKMRFVTLGYNYVMTDDHAALLRCQLKKIDEILNQRRALAKRYTQILNEFNPVIGTSKVGPMNVPDRDYYVSTPMEPEGYGHTYQRYVIFLEKHDGILVRNELQKRGIGVTFGYYDVTDEPFVRTLGIYKRCPISRVCYRKTVALPLFHTMTVEQQDRVLNMLREVLNLPFSVMSARQAEAVDLEGPPKPKQ
jgi:perosamine synthetase